ncbi:hypothetical protein QJS10_CPB14g01619 [Acorus calamus]|uniref:Cyclin C-terminal domain-containing protein n=1 Tax=Acorus calamus TaxID=4465 RepID=A0AAV9D9X2_ACOCL|nr:hypothetical protein QJS10_CPB14g01619 [Acorus calamus]
MAVLKALVWRLNPVTAHSYVEPLTWHRHAAIAARVTDLLLASLLDPMFLGFRPSVIAASALQCALEELTPSECDDHVPALASLDSLERCHKAMVERLVPPEPLGCSHNPCCPSSPVTVIPSRRMEIFDHCINFDALFGVCPSMQIKKKKGKTKELQKMATITAITSSFLQNQSFLKEFNPKLSLRKSTSFRVRAAKLPAGVELPKVEPKLSEPFLGFTKTAEIWNSRACMIGIIGTFIVELILKKGILQIIGVEVGKGLDLPL